ncbi:Six-hairpin glycosidase-like protein, partial [Jimgerdemannia flammicorona]
MWEWLKFDNKYGTIFTPGGMLYYENISDTGALRYALNSAWLAQMYADSPTTRGSHSAWRASAFAVRQLEYALGRNPIGMVFITGTEKSPVNISHRLAHGGNNINTPARNMHVIVGALLGGPNATDEYIDQRTNFKQAVPTLDYQAGFIGILASLINHQRADCLTTLHRILSLTTPFAALGLHIIYVCIRSWWNHRRE